MKILMVATCVLMVCFSSSHASAQNCKPDVSGQDKISKQQFDSWFKTVSTSGVAITVFVGRSAYTNWVNVQIDKQEAAATSNTQFQSPLHAAKGSLDKKGIDLSAPDPPVPPSDASITGKYTRKNKASDYIELKPDGRFSLQYDGTDYGGNYKVQVDILSVQVSHGPASTAHVNGNTLTFSDGNVYEKQAEPQKAEPQKAAAAAQLTIDQIIQMVAAKLPDDVIISTIRKSG